MSTEFLIKCREKGDKKFRFLTPRGETNRLRIHAARFSRDKAERLIADNQGDNPEWEFIIVPA